MRLVELDEVFARVQHTLNQLRIVALDETVAIDAVVGLQLPVFFRHFIVFFNDLLFSAQDFQVLLVDVAAWLPWIIVVILVTLCLLTEPG